MEKDSINLADYKVLLKAQRQAFKRQLKKVKEECPLVASAYKWQSAMLGKVQAKNRILFKAEEAVLNAVIGNENYYTPDPLLICLGDYLECVKSRGGDCDRIYRACSSGALRP